MAAARVDEETVRAARDGDAAAFESLVRSTADAVYGHAYRYFADAGTAEDAVQEVYLKVFRSLGTFDGRSSFTTWLFRVTRNVCLDMLRAGRRRPVPVDPLDAVTAPVGDIADEAVASAALERALASLPPEDRDAFNAVALFDLSYEQAAEALETPVGTVKSRVHRARRSLVTLLGLGEGGD